MVKEKYIRNSYAKNSLSETTTEDYKYTCNAFKVWGKKMFEDEFTGYPNK